VLPGWFLSQLKPSLFIEFTWLFPFFFLLVRFDYTLLVFPLWGYLMGLLTILPFGILRSGFRNLGGLFWASFKGFLFKEAFFCAKLGLILVIISYRGLGKSLRNPEGLYLKYPGSWFKKSLPPR